MRLSPRLFFVLAISLLTACGDDDGGTKTQDATTTDSGVALDGGVTTDGTASTDGEAAKKLNLMACVVDDECLSGKCELIGDTAKACMQDCDEQNPCPEDETCLADGENTFCWATCTVPNDPNCTKRNDALVNCADSLCADEG